MNILYFYIDRKYLRESLYFDQFIFSIFPITTSTSSISELESHIRGPPPDDAEVIPAPVRLQILRQYPHILLLELPEHSEAGSVHLHDECHRISAPDLVDHHLPHQLSRPPARFPILKCSITIVLFAMPISPMQQVLLMEPFRMVRLEEFQDDLVPAHADIIPLKCECPILHHLT